MLEIERGDLLFSRMKEELKKVIVGLDRAIETCIIGLITPGDIHHIMLEGDPGVGKTLISGALARLIDGTDQRMQGNADLTPEAFTGYWKYLDDIGSKKILKPGMLTLQPWRILYNYFSNNPEILLTCNDFTKLPDIQNIVKRFPIVYLYDEVNRTNPWANGAVLEAMQEYKVTVGGVPIPLNPAAFFIFSRNKLERGQTYELPEAQISRIALEDELLAPEIGEARDLLRHDKDIIYQKVALSKINPVLDVDELLAIRKYIAEEIKVSEAMDEYIIKCVSGCLNHSFLVNKLGIKRINIGGEELYLTENKILRTDYGDKTSPGRIMLTIKQLVKSVAYIKGRKDVLPVDLRHIFTRAICHHIFVEPSVSRSIRGVKGSKVAEIVANTVIEKVSEDNIL
jgi:MoxR-like ATPase